jgi:hypothetical protein
MSLSGANRPDRACCVQCYHHSRGATRRAQHGIERFKRTAGHAGLAGVQRRARSSYWPAGTAAFHTGADIGDAVVRYAGATDDERLERDFGLDWSWWPKRPADTAADQPAAVALPLLRPPPQTDPEIG